MKCEIESCYYQAQRHHIVKRSQGGLDSAMNSKYLCANHHTMGADSPHRNGIIDKIYRQELQNKYIAIFDKEEYSIEEIHRIIGYEHKDLDKKFKTVKKNKNGLYNKEDIIRHLMGGKLL